MRYWFRDLCVSGIWSIQDKSLVCKLNKAIYSLIIAPSYGTIVLTNTSFPWIFRNRPMIHVCTSKYLPIRPFSFWCVSTTFSFLLKSKPLYMLVLIKSISKRHACFLVLSLHDPWIQLPCVRRSSFRKSFIVLVLLIHISLHTHWKESFAPSCSY